MNIITQEAKKKQAVVKSGRRFVLSLDMLYVIIIRQLLSERQMFMITVGNAELKDAERLLEIYDYYVYRFLCEPIGGMGIHPKIHKAC